jgi:acetylornithine deacetylase/succinyl-diaminopimelate desuccinylase-like protein
MSDEMREDYRVTGVFKDFPLNSHIRPRAFARFNPQTYFSKSPTFLTSWNSQGGYVYVKLKPGTDAKALMLLGIPTYGFAPLRLDADVPFLSLFHGNDERVPVSAIAFGLPVLHEVVERFAASA